MTRVRMRHRVGWWIGLLEAALALPVVKVLLTAFGYRRTVDLLRRSSPDGRSPSAPGAPVPVSVTVAASAVTTLTASRPMRSRCLTRSLTLWWLARWRGHELELVMGVAPPQAGVLLAHAWVEYGGTPVNDTPDVRTRYAALPSPTRRAN